MTRALGILCMLAGGAGFLYALYLLLSPAWTMLFGALFLYVMGYHLYQQSPSTASRFKQMHKRAAERTMEVVVDAAHDSRVNAGRVEKPSRSSRGKANLN